jgi:DHA2 family lincomycin resistance protein-like MFS transporter
MLMIGFFVAGVTILPFMTIQLDTPVWVTIIFLFFRGMPFAFAAVASQTIIYGPLESSKQGPASSIYNTLRQAAASFGVALIVTITISRTRAHEHAAVVSQHLTAPTADISRHAAVLGYHEAFLAVALLLGVPFLLAFFIDDKKAADTLRRRTVEVMAVE